MSTISASTTSTTAFKVTSDTTGTLVLQTGSTPTTAATIDASQNVGINNPSSTIRTKLMVSSSNSSDTLTVGTVSGGFSITNTNSSYGLQFGSLSTGNSWIQSARMDGTATAYNLLLQSGGGNVGVGTTSPNYKLEVASGTGAYTDIAVFRTAEATATSNAGGGFSAVPSATAGSRIAYMWLDADGANFSGSDYFYIQKTGNSGQADIVQSSSSPITFKVSSTERARISASGFFKASNDGTYIGSTGPYYEFTSNDASTGQSFIFYNSNASIAQSAMMFLGANRNTTNNTYYYFGCYNYTTSTYKLAIADSGNVTNTNNSYGAISDIKLKENITDATPKLEKLNQVRVVNYNFIGDDQKQLGVIAQELEQIFPGMVEESADTERVTTTDEDGNEVTNDVPTGTFTKSVKYSVFVPMLIKAIQEQQAIIETLTNRITALENK